MEPEVTALVNLIRQLAFLEATFWLSYVYALLCPSDHRKKLAMYFTPISLAQGLLNELQRQGVDFGTRSFADPACGGAAFLAPIALRMRAILRQRKFSPLGVLRHIERHIRGTDVDKTLCELSRNFLCMALSEEIQASGYVPKFRIERRDALMGFRLPLPTSDVVVCNPPYRKLATKELAQFRAAYGEVIDSQANLYALFMFRALRMIPVGGYAAFVTPRSFLSGRNFGRLRMFLLRHSTIKHIGMVSDRSGVFMNTQQETALTVLRRRSPLLRRATRILVSTVSGTGKYRFVGECGLPPGTAAWSIPRRSLDIDLLKAASQSSFRLSHYGYRVRVGAYVWNRDKRPKYESMRKALLGGDRWIVPLLWSRNISASRTLRVGDFTGNPQQPRFIGFSRKPHTSVVTAPCVAMQRVTSNDQPRRLVAAAVSQSITRKFGGFVGENHVLILEQIEKEPVLTPHRIATLLNTSVMNRVFKCISGAINVSVFELGQLALPEPQALKLALSKGNSMNDAVRKSFGLRPSQVVE